MSRLTIFVLLGFILFSAPAASGITQAGVREREQAGVSMMNRWARFSLSLEVVPLSSPWHERCAARMITNAWVSIACFMAFFGLGRSDSWLYKPSVG